MAFSISPLLNLALTSQIDVATTRWRNVSRIAHISLSAERCRHYGVLALHFGVTRVHGDEREILHSREARNFTNFIRKCHENLSIFEAQLAINNIVELNKTFIQIFIRNKNAFRSRPKENVHTTL